jgi:hypothetical protein
MGLGMLIRAQGAVAAAVMLTWSVPSTAGEGAGQRRIIDVHFHVGPDTMQTGLPTSPTPKNLEGYRAFASRLAQHNVVKVVACGPREYVLALAREAPERVVGSPFFPYPFDKENWPDVGQLRADYQAGRLGAMGEVVAQLWGLAPDDPKLEPYFALAEEQDIPVGYHVGLAPEGVNFPGNYIFAPRYRMKLSDPLLLEDVLMRHPRLRLYVMHAGWPMLDRMLGLLHTFPQVYAELGWLDRLPMKEYQSYLRRLTEAGYGKRLMFGSDADPEGWPGNALAALDAADFLSAQEKTDILYDNAARFLRISDASR